MKKVFTLLTFLIIATAMVFAGERSEQQMRDAAMKALGQNLRRAAGNQQMKEFLTMEKLKIYGYAEGGFAVVTKDDRFDEVIGYSATKYSDAMPPGFKWWLESANKVMENPEGQVSRRARANNTMKQEGVAPLITTKWGQQRPYNDKCKKTIEGKEYSLLTGCVATAMAQVMNYYKYPAKGKGENSYKVNYSDWGKQTFSANFENSTYDWSNMLDDYSNYRYSNTQDLHTEAVSKLMSDCGISVNMQYTTYSSGANPRLIPIALKNYFSYSFMDNTKTIYYRKDYSDVDWINIVYNALNDNHPIIYGGYGGQGGHAFVIHGYDSDGKVIVNWGWNGNYDGAFAIDMLSPGKYSYNDNQNMIIPIPENQAVVTNVHKLTYIVDGNKYKEYELKTGETITPEPAPTKTGYIFSGWSSIPQTMPAKDVTVKGTFSKESYQLTYKIDGAVYKTLNYNYGATITPEPSPTREGYSFSGWSNIPSTMPANNVTVTGSFAINNYTLTYIVDGETYKSYDLKYGVSITPESEPTKDGYIFSGWSEIPSTMPAKDVTITGTFSKGTYKLIYKIDGAVYKTLNYNYGATINPEPSPAKEGYSFSGWSTVPSTMPANDVTVTGSFAINKYTLIYMVDGKTYKSYEFKYGASITPESEPTKDGYTFSGWSDIPSTMPAKDVTITGTFSKGTYKLTYKVDGAVYKILNYNYGATITPELSPAKDGYSFSGWSDLPSTMPANDVTVTGSFAINNYTLTYIVDGETYRSYDLKYGVSITPESEPTKDGYTFSGWSDIPSTMPSFNVTVTGEFIKNSPSANTVTVKIDGIYYILIGSAGTAEVTSSPNKYSGDITIPETVEYEGFTYQVTQIGEKAFNSCYNLLSISIPSSVTRIGNNAFEYCNKLSSVIIPNSIQDMGSHTFDSCI